jgi:glutathione S-transferase
MLILYHCFSARSFRPLWALEEMGLPYQLNMLPFPPRVHQKDYLAINPLGTIPALVDGDTLMTESAAICEYLATRYGPTDLAVRVDEPGYGAYLNALHFGEATLTFPQTLVLRYSRLEPEERRVPQVADDYAKWFLGRLRAVEARMAKHATMAADRFTMADISVAYALMLARNLGLDAQFTPGVAAYWERVSVREGYKRAFARQVEAAKTAGLRAAM